MTSTLPALRVDDEMAAILRTLNLDPALPEVRALALVARRYNLDPVIGEIELIGDSHRGFKTYITRDGLIRIAHRSGKLDGIVVDEQRRNSTNDGWTAFVSVWRRDMTHAFRYGAQCKDTERQAKSGYGLEQAVARAERRALKRAFAISGIDEEPVETDAYVVDVGEPVDLEVPELMAAGERGEQPTPAGGEVSASAATPVAGVNQGPAHAAIGKLPKEDQDRFLADHGIEQFGDIWPAEAVDDALERPF